MNEPDRAIAFHEAGHAVAMLANCAKVDHIAFTDGTGDVLGHVIGHRRWHEGRDAVCIPASQELSSSQAAWLAHARECARLDIIDLMAGPVAEDYYRWNDWDAVDFEGLEFSTPCLDPDWSMSSDFMQIRPRLQWSHPEDALDAFHIYWCQTIELVKAHWKAIEELAEMLLRDRRIEAESLYDWWHARYLAA